MLTQFLEKMRSFRAIPSLSLSSSFVPSYYRSYYSY